MAISSRLSCACATARNPGRGDHEIVHITAAAIASTVALAPILIAPALAADPLGTWLTGDKKGKMRIVNCGGALCGNLVWLQEPNDPGDQPAEDSTRKTPTRASRARPLLGIPIVLSMKPSGADKWEGQVYNSRDGQTYSGSFTMTGANTAELKGCVAVVHLQVADLDALELMLAPASSRCPRAARAFTAPAGRTTPRALSGRVCRRTRRLRRGWQRRV